MRIRSFVAISMVGFLAACSGGGSTASGSFPDCNSEGATFCLTACNLGCTVDGGCAINSIAQNQPLELVFSQSISPESVNAASISLKTASGEAPTGSFQVDGNVLRFLPEVRLVAGVTTFGFRANEEYILTLPGGPTELLSVASTSGDRLARTVACSLSVDRGLVDLNNRAPTGSLLSPTIERNVPSDPTIIVEFDELIDVSPFQGSSTASSPIRYLLRRTDPITGEPDPNFTPVLVPGVPQAEVTLGANPTTRISLRPLIPLPSSVCIEVLVTDQVRDISGTPAVPAIFRFYTQVGTPTPRSVQEAFTGIEKLDSTVSSALWGGGSVRPGVIGGDGRHGSFDITLLPQAPGGEFVWDTDTVVTVPAAATLLGEQNEDIVDGMAEFSDFTLQEGRTLRITGSRPPVIRVAGGATIDGTIIVDGASSSDGGSTSIGGAGGLGGPGGGEGGRGADSHLPAAPPAVIAPGSSNVGSAGGDLVVPAGSGYAGAVAGTGGAGGPVFPPSGNHALVNTTIQGFYSSQQITGAGGGGFLVAGQPGTIPVRLGSDPADLGPPAAGGSPVGFTLAPVGVDSIDHFLVGGSGGGGGGSACTLVRPAILSPIWMRWTNGFGGGGGGGAVAIRAGGAVAIGALGRVSAVGGSAASSLGNTWQDRGASVGGGGSGGSVLFQVAGSFSQSGVIDVSGGVGGVFTCSAPGGAAGESRGGDGAPGYVRLESAGATPGLLGTVVGPTVGPDNVGMLEASDPRSVARSTWYPLNSLLPPRLLNFTMTVRIGTTTVVYTDDVNAPGGVNLPNGNGPITLKMQGAQLDLVELLPTETPGPWIDTIQELAQVEPTGFRFLIYIDATAGSDIEVLDFTVNYES